MCMLIQLYFRFRTVVLNSAKSPLNHKRFPGVQLKGQSKYKMYADNRNSCLFHSIRKKISNLPIATFQMYLIHIILQKEKYILKEILFFNI